MDEKINVYELHIEDMLRTIKSRLDEFAGERELDDFEQGRQLAYTEVWEIIESRHRIILEVLNDDDEG